MTDKLQKIREEVVGIINSINLFAPDEDGKNSSYEEGRLVVASQILQIIDSLQEEPVSIDFEQELYKAFGQVKDFTLGMQIAKWFYDMGYHQAEKDLALTWEDIRDICRMWIESKTPFGVTGEALSIEVLKRFNKQKEDGKI